MNEELRALYQEVIIDHGRHPRNFKKLEGYSCCQEAYNPLCGDRLTLYLKLDKDKILDASFEGGGCAISMASTSLMIERIKNTRISEAQQLFDSFHHLVTAPDSGADVSAPLGKLKVLGGVRDFPTRIKCATLAWHALKAGLENVDHDKSVSTE
ncbi:SUF system NifU family Fe-S cluster assembly protein [Thalassotalea sp. 42_200_T64]|nr:SUF system NifU family Fe-S cluster assembly protein [Thalassotalea sp. 42_200_T64]